MQPTVMLIHSGGFTSRQWRRLAEQLAPHYRVLTPDLLGYGKSGPWPDGEPFQLRRDVDHLEALLGDQPAHLVGHSYGGFLALQLALRNALVVRSIAVYEPVAFGVLDEVQDADALGAMAGVRRTWEPGESGADEAWLRAFVEWWNGPGAWDMLNEETRASMRTVGWKIFQEVIGLTSDRTDRASYSKITTPTLLLAGENSPMTERRAVERLAEALPHATLRVFPGVGHMGPISHAALINEAITTHLAAHS